MSKYGVFSGPYFPVFGLNTEIYFVVRTTLFTLTCVYLFTLTYHYYTNLITLIKYRKYRNCDEIFPKFSRLKSISSTEDDYLETATGSVVEKKLFLKTL